MNNERWSEVKGILAEVLETSEAERASALSRLCGEDVELREAVESLLQLEARANAVMSSPFALGASPQQAPQIDRYHLLQKVGEGGMGVVWLAEQKGPVRRRGL